MLLRNVKFRNIWGASGLVGFGGEKYRYHRLMDWCPGYGGFGEMTQVWKTTPIDGAAGNMPLGANFQPKEFKPSCIHVSLRSFFKGGMLNAIAFSAPPLATLIEYAIWDTKTEPFMFSFSFTGATPEARLGEASRTVKLIKANKYRINAPWGAQTNWSCGNRDHHIDELIGEFDQLTEIFAELECPLVPKINGLFPMAVVKHMAGNRHVDALVCSNAIKWTDLPDGLKMDSFGTLESPLAKYGGGAFSGGDWLRIVSTEAIRNYRREGILKPISGGGGIRSKAHVLEYKKAGADGVSIGSGIYPLRFWRGKSVIRYANEIFPME